MSEIHCMDGLELMESLPEHSIDMAFLDLPYEVTQNQWDIMIPFAPMWAGLERVCKPNAALVCTAKQPFTSLLVGSNLKRFRYEWIWEKSVGTGHLNVKRMPMQCHESVLLFSNGKETYNPLLHRRESHGSTRVGKQTSNYGEFKSRRERDIPENMGYPRSVIKFNTAYHDREAGLHPNQKPVALVEYFILTYTDVGETVLDFACGSGTTAVAARKCGRRFVCGDNSPLYVERAQERLAAPFVVSMFGETT